MDSHAIQAQPWLPTTERASPGEGTGTHNPATTGVSRSGIRLNATPEELLITAGIMRQYGLGRPSVRLNPLERGILASVMIARHLRVRHRLMHDRRWRSHDGSFRIIDVSQIGVTNNTSVACVEDRSSLIHNLFSPRERGKLLFIQYSESCLEGDTAFAIKIIGYHEDTVSELFRRHRKSGKEPIEVTYQIIGPVIKSKPMFDFATNYANEYTYQFSPLQEDHEFDLGKRKYDLVSAVRGARSC